MRLNLQKRHFFKLLYSFRSDVRRLSPQQGNEVRRGHLHLRADLSGGDADGVEQLRRLVEHRGELLFHAHRGTAAVDIARQGLSSF